MSDFLAQHARFYSQGYFFGKLFDLGDYPGAIVGNDTREKVVGDIFIIHDAPHTFAVLDEYEEVGNHFPVPNEYKREEIIVYTHQEEKLEAWVYLYNHPTGQLSPIFSGDFLKHGANT